jgi:hypothetical protein
MVYGQIIWITEYVIPGRYGPLKITNEFESLKDADAYIYFIHSENPAIGVTLRSLTR